MGGIFCYNTLSGYRDSNLTFAGRADRQKQKLANLLPDELKGFGIPPVENFENILKDAFSRCRNGAT